jgi:hypothetical protein
MPVRIFAALVGLLLAAVFTTATGNAAESKVRDDIMATVMIMDGPRDRSCTERKITKTDMIEARPDGTPVVERWTLDRCGKLVKYRVRFTPNSKGGTDFDVQIEK